MNMKIGLIGNPNCGKTTFFNKITGGNEYVGNRAGVTVKETVRKIKGENILLCDLPGIYSLSGYSKDEKTAIRFLSQEEPDGIINIADGTNLERSLYLTICLCELNIPMVLAVNMKDECDKKKIRIDIKKLSELLGIKTVFISSKNREGFSELLEAVRNMKASDIHSYDRFAKKLGSHNKNNEKSGISKGNSIYRFADEITESCVKKENAEKKKFSFTDKILLGKYTAYPVMLFIIGVMFYITFGPVGELFKNILLKFYNSFLIIPLVPFFHSVNPIVSSAFFDGILKGGESVVSFLPQLFLLFLFIAFLEDSGYMSRAAYITDKPMRKFGLSGKSVVSMLLGFGCTLTAVMSSRIIKDEKEREKTVFLLPFMSCGAKISVYYMAGSMLFKEKFFIVIFFLYLFGTMMFFVSARIFMKRKSEDSFFYLELPPLRIPSFKSVIRTAFFQIKDFLKRAGSIVVLLSLIIWFLNNFDFSLSMVPPESGILSSAGKSIKGIFSPLGFGNYPACTALISGIFAKESIAVSLSVLAGGVENIPLLFNKAQAVSFMVFVLFYTPCLSASAVMVKESSSKIKAVSVLVFYSLFAYLTAFVVYRIII